MGIMVTFHICLAHATKYLIEYALPFAQNMTRHNSIIGHTPLYADYIQLMVKIFKYYS